jgi:hypothetical protein
MHGKVTEIRPGVSVSLENYLSREAETSGRPQAETRWRISPTLDELRRRKTLTTEEHAAACRFLREYYVGLIAVVGPRTQNYEPSSRSANAYDPVAEKIHFAKETERVILAIDPIYYPALRWLLQTLGDSKPLSSLGDDYAPGLGAQTQSARCGAAVALLCACLCRAYGLTHRLDVEKRIESLSRILLEKQG